MFAVTRFRYIKPLFLIQWNLDETNLYITQSTVERTIFFALVVIVKYNEEKNLDHRITKPRYRENNYFASPSVLRYIEVLLLILTITGVKKNRPLYQGLRFREVCLIEVPLYFKPKNTFFNFSHSVPLLVLYSGRYFRKNLFTGIRHYTQVLGWVLLPCWLWFLPLLFTTQGEFTCQLTYLVKIRHRKFQTGPYERCTFK